MKKLFWIALFITSATFAQRRSFHNNDRTNVIKHNIFGVFSGQYQLAYEKIVSDHFALQLSLGYIGGGNESGSSTVNGENHNYSVSSSGFIAIPEIRYYFGENGPKGMYVAGLMRYRHKEKDLKDSENGTSGINQDLSRTKTIKAFGGGVVLGYQWVTQKGFSIDLFGGYTSKDRTIDYDYDNASLNASSPNPEFSTIGEELFSEKYLNFKDESTSGTAIRIGLNIGYAF